MNKKTKKMSAVMMEYVLIAVLIAAAVVGAVMYFGKQTSSGLAQAGVAINSPTASKNMRTQATKNAGDAALEASNSAQNFHDGTGK